MAEHNVYLHLPNSFVIFNDTDLPFAPISAADIIPGTVTGMTDQKSQVWSADMQWFFVIMPDHITLLNVYSDRALRCRVRSAEFIRYCLDGGLLAKSLSGRKPVAAHYEGTG